MRLMDVLWPACGGALGATESTSCAALPNLFLQKRHLLSGSSVTLLKVG